MISIKVPPLGESIVEATVARWLKKEGEAVAAGDTLVELETDKVTVEVPALKGGVLSRQVKHDGDVVAVDDVLGEIDESASGATAGPSSATEPSKPAAPASAPAASPPAPAAAVAASTQPAADVKASPAARRVAAEGGVDLASISGTGRGGVVSKPDVIEQGSRAPKSDGAAAPAAARAPEQPRPAAPKTVAPTGTRETRAAFYPVLSAQLGVAINYEVLP